MVRPYVQEEHEADVRRIWAAGLLANTKNASLNYPSSLVAEEEEFVRSTLAEGDMVDLRAAYQSADDPRTGFWVALDVLVFRAE